MDNSVTAGDSVFSKITGTYINPNTNVTESSDMTDSYLDFNDYLKLIVAQMQNQDFNDPMDDKEIVATMSQYSMLEGIKNMTQQSGISYATSLVGKVVTVDDGTGAYTGLVESVTVTDGTPYLMIDGQQYKSDKVTDIVNEDTFNNLMSLLGYTIKKRGAEDSEAIGQITNILYKGGTSYVVAGGELYPVESVQIVSSEIPGAETGESGEESGSGEEESSEDDGETVTQTAEVNSEAAAASYTVTTQSLIETFMNELDGITAASAAKAASAVSDPYDVYIAEIAQTEVPDYAAGIYADSEAFTSDTLYADGTDGENGSLSRDYENVEISTSYTNTSNLDPDTAERTASGKLKGVTTAKGVSTKNCVPHRISVEAYPEEAALADELGTRMYDIRFINNRAITSRIKTGEVIGHTSGGKAITEIGFSGVGKLGEVVTFADGTQRVEIIHSNGNSSWLMTTGRYTLDQICDKNAAPGSLKDLDPEETAIRHYSDPFSEMDNSDEAAFGSYIKSIT